METEKIQDRIELEQQLKEHQEDAMVHINDAINSYYTFRKNVLIGAIIHINASFLETPDIVGMLHAHSVYNSHTGKLIICFESPSAFIDFLRDRISDEAIVQNKIPLKKLEDALVRSYEESSLLEFIDISKMSIQDYFKSFEKKPTDDNSI